MSLLILFGGAGAAASGLNITPLLRDLLPLLQAEEFSTLVFWNEAELYQLTDEAAKRLDLSKLVRRATESRGAK